MFKETYNRDIMVYINSIGPFLLLFNYDHNTAGKFKIVALNYYN